MEFNTCKFYPNAVVYNNEKEYSLIRSACGPNYNFSSGQNKVLCPNAGFIVKCPEGHKMTYLTSELKRFAGKSSVRCRVCGHYTFVRDAEIYCLSNLADCNIQL